MKRRVIPRMAVPDVTAARELVAAIPDELVAAIVDEQLQLLEHRRLERETRAARGWRPPWRCDSCSAYTSSAVAACKRCGHTGASNDEGARTSYERAHRRRARSPIRPRRIRR